MDAAWSGTGLPLLSGHATANPLPDRAESSCRRCAREFNFLFSRARRCNHCGYAFCSNCTEFQALMPRADENNNPGYEPCQVCAYCIDMLRITASSKARLKGVPLSKLRAYMTAYNLKFPSGTLEKDDLIDIIVNNREPNGCLPAQNEAFYRRQSVPSRTMERQSSTARARTLFTRSTNNPTFSTLPAAASSHPSMASRAAPHPVSSRATQSTLHRGPIPLSRSPPMHQPPRMPVFQATSDRSSRPEQSVPFPQTARAATPLPTLEQLLGYTIDQLNDLSVHNLKGILFANHVNARLAVEKSELVQRLVALIEQEKADRVAARLREEEEIREARERAEKEDEERIRVQRELMALKLTADSKPKSEEDPSLRLASQVVSDRGGLCVICQDEDANIVIVDCGHLCLCRSCSDVVMSSSRECPMCRTRIITEARLLRVFKT